MSVTRILLVDDDSTLCRLAFAQCLANETGVEVVGIARPGQDVVGLASRHRPDILLLGIKAPDQWALEAAKQIRREWPRIQIVFLSGSIGDSHVEQAIGIDVAGYIDKAETLDNVIRAVEMIADGKSYFSPSILERLNTPVDGKCLTTEAKSRQSILSPREVEVLGHIASGLSAKEVASLLYISERTVNNHRTNLMKKLDIHDRVKLTRFAIREGLSEL